MKFYIVDVFAEQKYQGNQLAVLVPDRALTTGEMQQIAREINFSETTFVQSGKQPNGGYDVRIFTPDIEIPFAGHPTLGTAHVIHKLLEVGTADKVILNLGVGQIPVTVDETGLTMLQNQPEFDRVLTDKKAVADILKINGDDIRDDYPIQIVSTGLPCVVIPVNSLDAVARCSVNHELFQAFIDTVLRCNLLVFAPDSAHDLRVRVFMDDPGFLEDPATGSANGNLAGYLLKYNYFGSHQIQYTVGQGIEMGRPSVLRMNAELTGETYKIQVGGNVHLVAEGTWH